MITRKNVRFKGEQTREYFQNHFPFGSDMRIKDLRPGRYGFCVPWAYNPKTGQLNTDYAIYLVMNQLACMQVKCISWGLYEIEIIRKGKPIDGDGACLENK